MTIEEKAMQVYPVKRGAWGRDVNKAKREAYIKCYNDILKDNTFVIEKELCNPVTVNGYAEVDGPYYHLYQMNGDEKILIKTVNGDIKEAARELERMNDMGLLAMAYKENPNSFMSVVNCRFEDIKPVINYEAMPRHEAWVARSKDGSLGFSDVEPMRAKWAGTWIIGYTKGKSIHLANITKIDSGYFPELKWEDEPMKAELIIVPKENEPDNK